MPALHWNLGGVELELSPERAAFRADRRELLVADVHLGKAAALRRAGRAVPEGTTAGELARIDALVASHRAERITFLGDLFHGEVDVESPTAARFAAWLDRASQSIECTLVAGNHDRRVEALLNDLPRLRTVTEPWAPGPGLDYRHHAAPPVSDAQDAAPPRPWVAGHLHPGVRLDEGAGALKLPVFWHRTQAGAEGLTLPTFGSFTGLYLIEPGPRDRLGAITPTGVVELPGTLSPG